MIYPGSFIWRRIDDNWVVSRSAAKLFAVSSIVILAMTGFFFLNINASELGTLSNALLAAGGVCAAASVFFLWGGMWKYWMRFESSSPSARRAWLLLLVVGLWYGAILYYVFRYLGHRESADL